MQRMIKKGDVVRVVNNLGSPWLDHYIGEIAEVARVTKVNDKRICRLEQIPDIEFFSTELQLDEEIFALVQECMNMSLARCGPIPPQHSIMLRKQKQQSK